MMLIFGVMLLLQTAACLDRFCRFNQSDPCYAALGHKLSLQMVDANLYKLKIQKKITSNPQDDPVCKIKNDSMKMNECDLYNNRSVTVINGTLIINHVIRSDSGNYRLTLDCSEGAEALKYLQVNVEDHAVTPIILGCFALILIVLVAIAYYFYKKKNRLKPTPKNETSKKNVKNEQELHYGEVTFTNNKDQQQPSKKQEECVYAQVQSH